MRLARVLAAGLLTVTVGMMPASQMTYWQAWHVCRAQHAHDTCVDITADAVALGTVKAPPIW